MIGRFYLPSTGGSTEKRNAGNILIVHKGGQWFVFYQELFPKRLNFYVWVIGDFDNFNFRLRGSVDESLIMYNIVIDRLRFEILQDNLICQNRFSWKNKKYKFNLTYLLFNFLFKFRWRFRLVFDVGEWIFLVDFLKIELNIFLLI